MRSNTSRLVVVAAFVLISAVVGCRGENDVAPSDIVTPPTESGSFTISPTSTYAVYIQNDRGVMRTVPLNGESRFSKGSGVFIDSSGIILTNNHVIQGARHLYATWNNYRYEATLIGTDPLTDLATLKINPMVGQPANSFPSAPLGDSDALVAEFKRRVAANLPGQDVYAIGFPYTANHHIPTVTKGIISNVEETIPDISRHTYFIVTDTQLVGGSSGGFLIYDGKVVGVTILMAKATSFGYFIPINTAKNLIPQLMYGDVLRGKSSLTMWPLREIHSDIAVEITLRDAYNLVPPPQSIVPFGSIVIEAPPGGAGAIAGIERGDVITHVDGLAMHDIIEFFSYVEGPPPGASYTITFYRYHLLTGWKQETVQLQTEAR